MSQEENAMSRWRNRFGQTHAPPFPVYQLVQAGVLLDDSSDGDNCPSFVVTDDGDRVLASLYCDARNPADRAEPDAERYCTLLDCDPVYVGDDLGEALRAMATAACAAAFIHRCATLDDDGRPRKPDTVTCGGCGRSWCERCDGTPGPLCHFCHGRGYSLAEVLA